MWDALYPFWPDVSKAGSPNAYLEQKLLPRPRRVAPPTAGPYA